MRQDVLIPHLFRTEFRKIAAVLSKHFGIAHLEMAEDIASETFLSALETWSYQGLPENPVAWLYSVAKNKARNQLNRNRIFQDKVVPKAKGQEYDFEEPEIDLSEKNITDSQLQMLFAICHTAIPVEAQIGLSLRILCGFGIDEIASAFLTSRETIQKRLYRAREKLRNEKVSIEAPSAEAINERLETVLTTLYLLFSEGYYSESQDEVLREDLCLEAMRLTHLLIDHEPTNLPRVNALLSLMCFHASRFPSRKKQNGEIVLYQDQDESLWNQDLIARGVYYLHQASHGKTLSKYHLEAGIAYWHTQKTDTREKWEHILQLYNHLLQFEYSPIAALNRAYALSKTAGKEKAITEAEKLNLTNNHYYYALLGELYTDIVNEKAIFNLQKALDLAKSQTDKNILAKKLNSLLMKKSGSGTN